MKISVEPAMVDVHVTELDYCLSFDGTDRSSGTVVAPPSSSIID